MAYTKPVFNTVCDVWINPNTPNAGPADQTDVPCQFYIASKAALDITPANPDEWAPPIYLRFDAPPVFNWKGAWIFQLTTHLAVSYYRARWKEFVHLDFPNEYHVVVVEQCDDLGAGILAHVP